MLRLLIVQAVDHKVCEGKVEIIDREAEFLRTHDEGFNRPVTGIDLGLAAVDLIPRGFQY